jgi:hypothetical protein
MIGSEILVHSVEKRLVKMPDQDRVTDKSADRWFLLPTVWHSCCHVLLFSASLQTCCDYSSLFINNWAVRHEHSLILPSSKTTTPFPNYQYNKNI